MFKTNFKILFWRGDATDELNGVMAPFQKMKDDLLRFIEARTAENEKVQTEIDAYEYRIASNTAAIARAKKQATKVNDLLVG